MKKYLPVALAAGVILVVFVALLVASAGGADLQPPLNPSLASAALASFPGLGTAVRIQEDTLKGNRRVLETKTDMNKVAWVDDKGRVIGVSGEVARVASGTVGHDEAVKRVGLFLKSVHPAFSSMQLVADNAVPNSAAYFLQWQEVSSDGVLLPNYVSVMVSLRSGAVTSYHAGFDDGVMAAAPRVSIAEVEKAWRAKSGPTAELKDKVAIVATDLSGRQRVAYRFTYIERRPIKVSPSLGGSATEVSGEASWFDADTGADITSEMP